MNRQDKAEAESITERVREKLSPNWRKQHALHLKMLHAGPATKGMGAKDIIQRALILNGVPTRKQIQEAKKAKK